MKFKRLTALILVVGLAADPGLTFVMNNSAGPLVGSSISPSLPFNQEAFAPHLANFDARAPRLIQFGMTRLAFMALGLGGAATAAAQSNPQARRRNQVPKVELARLNKLRRPDDWGESQADKDAYERTNEAIKRLDSPEMTVRAAARDELIQLIFRVESEQFHMTEPEGKPKNPYEYAASFQPITARLETFFANGRNKTHTRSGIWKIMAVVLPARARTMAKDFFGYSYAAEIFDRAVRLARTTLYADHSNGRDDTDQTTDVYLSHMANLGRQYLTGSSLAPLRAAAGETPPTDADAFITVNYLSILGVLQERYHLFNADALARLIMKIIQKSELDPEQGLNLNWDFKVGPDAIRAFKGRSEFLFASAHELGHNWAYGVSALLAGNRSSLQLKAIDEFIGDVFGLMLLEALGILDGKQPAASLFHDEVFCLSCVIGSYATGLADEAGRLWISRELVNGTSAPRHWAGLLRAIARELPLIHEHTMFQEFLNALLAHRAAAAPLRSPTRFGWLRSRAEIAFQCAA